LTKEFKDKIQKSLVEDILLFGGCKAVSRYSLAKFLTERVLVYGPADSLQRKAAENYFYYFNRLSPDRLFEVQERLADVEFVGEEDNESEDEQSYKVGLSPQREPRTPSYCTPPRRAAGPEVTFATMSSSKQQGKHIRANH
jgi:hypothetical protein